MRLYAVAYLSENEQTSGIIDVCQTKAEAIELRAKLRAQDASRQYVILRYGASRQQIEEQLGDQLLRLEIPKA